MNFRECWAAEIQHRIVTSRQILAVPAFHDPLVVEAARFYADQLTQKEEDSQCIMLLPEEGVDAYGVFTNRRWIIAYRIREIHDAIKSDMEEDLYPIEFLQSLELQIQFLRWAVWQDEFMRDVELRRIDLSNEVGKEGDE